MGIQLDSVFAGEDRSARCTLAWDGRPQPVVSTAHLLGTAGGWVAERWFPLAPFGGAGWAKRWVLRSAHAHSTPIGWAGVDQQVTNGVVSEVPKDWFTVAFTAPGLGVGPAAIIDINGSHTGDWTEADPDHVVIEAGGYRVDLFLLPSDRPN